VALWLSNVKNGIDNTVKFKILSPEDSAKEYIVMGLRTNSGIYESIFKRASHGKSILEFLNAEILQFMINSNLVKYTDNNFAVTPHGIPLLDLIVEKLLIKN